MSVTFKDMREATLFKAGALSSIRAMMRLDWYTLTAPEAQAYFEAQARDRKLRFALIEPFALYCMSQISGYYNEEGN